MYTESKINKVTSLINSCKVLLKNVEGKMMVNEQKRYIQTVMQKNVNSMMKNKPKLKKKVTIIDDNDNRSRLDSELFKDSDYSFLKNQTTRNQQQVKSSDTEGLQQDTGY